MSNYICNREVLGPGRTDGSNTPNPLSIQTIPDGSSNTSSSSASRDFVKNIAATWGVRSSTTSADFRGPASSPRLQPGQHAHRDRGPPSVWRTTASTRTECQFLFADGSVHFINNAIQADPTDVWTNFPANATNYTLQNLAHPADGNTVSNY